MTTTPMTAYPVGRERQPNQAPALVDELVRYGVTVPAEISRGACHLRDLSPIEERALSLPMPDDLLAVDEETLMAIVRQRASAAAVSRDARRGVFQELQSALADALADALAGIADDVVDQLRDLGRPAAEALHQATRLGIDAQTTEASIIKSANLDELAPAWNSLEAYVAQLERLTDLRFRLSTTTGAPPIKGWDQTGRSGQIEYERTAKAAAFGLENPWQVTREERPWQRWIRLSATAPVKLASIGEAHAVMTTRGAMLAGSTLRQVPLLASQPAPETFEVI